MDDLVYLNGSLVARADARVSPFDRGFLYGDGLFETARIVAGLPFRLGKHLERLNASAAALGWGSAPVEEGLATAVAELIERNGVEDGYLRVTATRGEHRGKLTELAAPEPTLLVEARAMDLPPLEQPPEWVLAPSPVRVHAAWPTVRHKTTSYQGYLLALAEGRARGADEVYLANEEGHLTEGAITNLFFVRDDTVCTPDEGCGLLPGVTRATVLEICEERGLAAETGRYRPEELRTAREVFCTNSLRGVVRVRKLVGEPEVRYSGHHVTRELQAAYADLARRECPPL